MKKIQERLSIRIILVNPVPAFNSSVSLKVSKTLRIFDPDCRFSLAFYLGSSKGDDQSGTGLQIICIYHTRAWFLKQFQLHTRGKPLFRSPTVVVECCSVNVLGMFWVDDSCTLKPQRFVSWLKNQLRFVIPPRTVWGGDDCFTERSNSWNWGIKHMISKMLF